jgi:hypothetical protein
MHLLDPVVDVKELHENWYGKWTENILGPGTVSNREGDRSLLPSGHRNCIQQVGSQVINALAMQPRIGPE